MLVFDQLKKSDPQLQLLAVVVASGLGVLAMGLWWVQIVQAREYRSSLETQSYRTVRLQSVRGKILDRNGAVLAENRATFNLSIYLDDLGPLFRKEYRRLRPMTTPTNSIASWKRWLGIAEIKPVPIRLPAAAESNLVWEVRCSVVSQIVTQLAVALGEPGLPFNTNEFKRHYNTRRALPFPVLRNASPVHLARFSEKLAGNIAADLEIQSTRVYPNQTTAAHVLGYLRRDNTSPEDEGRDFYHRLPDYRGVVGIEGHYDSELRGRAGGKSVLVNNLGYRQSEEILDPTEPGRNVVLTLDLGIQREAERSLRSRVGADARGAVVVMDVQSGDVLALVSSPASDPNYHLQLFPPQEWARWTNASLGLQKNRATWEQYQPGSTFKTIIALAALESGLNPNEKYRVEPNPAEPSKGVFFIGRSKWRDTAAPGDYDLRRAIVKSSNAYFINAGLRPGVFPRVVELAHRLHFGEAVGLPLKQESRGNFPDASRLRSGWSQGDTANICIGQGEMDVTPMQMAVLTAALANGGKVLQPRLVERLESQEPASLEPPRVFPSHQVRGQLGVRPANLQLVRDAMLDETEDAEGTGRHARVPGLRICGKTGTAERIERGTIRNTTWFISFAPHDRPRHAVVVMVEDGVSGGATCAPVAADIYSALLKMDRPSKPLARAP